MISVFCFKQKTAYEMRISDWSSDVCSSDRPPRHGRSCQNWLSRTNEVISCAYGTAFPVGGLQQRRIEQPQDALQRLLHAVPSRSGQSGNIARLGQARSEERRVGKECVNTCISRWSPIQ